MRKSEKSAGWFMSVIESFSNGVKFDEAEKFTKNHVMFFFNIHVHDFIVHVGPKPENV